MQANTIQTALDNPATTAKSGRNNSPVIAPEFSFNQILDKEIFNNRAPEITPAKPAPVNAPAPAPASPTNSNNSINTNAGNNASENSNNQANTTVNANQAPASAQTPAKTDKTDSGDNKTGNEDDSKSKKDDDIGSQIIALVGNLAAAQSTIESDKKTVSTKTDAGKTDKLAPSGKDISINLVGDSSSEAKKLTPDALGKSTSATQNLAMNAGENKSDGTAVKTSFATIAAQLVTDKTDKKSVDKSLANNAAASAAPDTNKGLLADVDANATLASTLKDGIATTSKSTGNNAEKVKSVSAGDVKSVNIDASQKPVEKTADIRATTPAEQSSTLTKDIAQTRESLPEPVAGITGAPNKNTQQIVAPPPVGQTGINAAQFNVANALTSEQITPRVGGPGWDKAVGQKVVWMVGEGLQSAELTLNPPDLGPLQVVLKVSNDQANASFSSAQPEVREALESALPRLRQMLSDAGVQLSGFSVNSQSAGQNQNFAQQQPRAINTARLADGNVTTETTVSATSTRTSQIKTNDGLVDTFV